MKPDAMTTFEHIDLSHVCLKTKNTFKLSLRVCLDIGGTFYASPYGSPY